MLHRDSLYGLHQLLCVVHVAFGEGSASAELEVLRVFLLEGR